MLGTFECLRKALWLTEPLSKSSDLDRIFFSPPPFIYLAMSSAKSGL